MRHSASILPFAIAALALACSGAARATTVLDNQYSVSSSATNVGANAWQFNYTVTNNNQGSGSQTGLDGFTIYIPTAATVVSSTTPDPYNGAPGFWSQGSGASLDLGGNGTQNLAARDGYLAYTWWGQNTQSVYEVGSTATYSITLSNVSVGTDTAGVSTYFGFAQPLTGQAYTTVQYGNYSTFTTDVVSATSAVPEPASLAMLLSGLGLIGFMTRRQTLKKAAIR